MTTEIININEWLKIHAVDFREIIKQSPYFYSFDKKFYTMTYFSPKEVVKLNCEVKSEEE